MNLLGKVLADQKPVRIALRTFRGIGQHTSDLICRKLELHHAMLVSQLSENQVNSLTALLSEPVTFSINKRPTLLPFPASASEKISAMPVQPIEYDPLANLVIESDLRRLVNANIAHHRNIGTHRGRRHAMRYPVRGQGTRNNAKTAKKLNRIDRA